MKKIILLTMLMFTFALTAEEKKLDSVPAKYMGKYIVKAMQVGDGKVQSSNNLYFCTILAKRVDTDENEKKLKDIRSDSVMMKKTGKAQGFIRLWFEDDERQWRISDFDNKMFIITVINPQGDVEYNLFCKKEVLE